jgi:hypothetical protein
MAPKNQYKVNVFDLNDQVKTLDLSKCGMSAAEVG